ncbi:MAG: SDR family oxidoreductase [Deltaproteobacteria bacterium]|nr:SDR family oxidoreductase [Deltaproteobacteria bacterium]MBW2722755.1 SDR family oxidoreductase [Deltaproteobacteria bacterium]
MTDYPLPNNAWELSGQVALVTGTTSGLGWRFAQVLAKAGAKVALTGRRTERLDELAELIRADGGECAPFRLDMTDMDNVIEVVGQAEEALGTVTILVNNAGIPDAQRAHKMDQALIDAVFDTNLRGPYVLSCEVARRLIAAKLPGRMVNLSSVGAFNYGGGGAALYSITKAAIARMSEVLAVEWARYNINVNCIAPGAFSSEMMDGMVERIGEFYKATPRGRLCDPAQLDSTLLYLCGPSSECVTGSIITVDDGQGPR